MGSKAQAGWVPSRQCLHVSPAGSGKDRPLRGPVFLFVFTVLYWQEPSGTGQNNYLSITLNKETNL